MKKDCSNERFTVVFRIWFVHFILVVGLPELPDVVFDKRCYNY